MIFDIKLALRYLAGRKLRTALTTLSILFGVMIIFGLNGVIPSLQDSLRNTMMLTAGQVDFTVTTSAQAPFDEKKLTRLQGIEGIQSYTGVLSRTILLPESRLLKTTAGNAITSLTLIGIDPDSYEQVRKIDLAGGTSFSSPDASEAYVTEGMAEKTGKGIGEKLLLPTAIGEREVRIVATLRDAPGMGGAEVYLPLATLQQWFHLTGEVNRIDFLFQRGADPEQVKGAILTTLGEGFQAGGEGVGSEFKAAMEMGQKVFTLFGLVAILMGGFILFITFRTIAVERKREIGLLRAIGATQGRILRLMLWEGILQGISGTLMGMVAGWLFVQLMFLYIRPIIAQFMKMDIGNPIFPPESYLLALLLGVGITILGGILPALQASRISPMEALRPSSGVTTKGEGRVRGWIGAVLLLLSAAGPVTGNLNLHTLGFFLFMAGLILLGPLLIRPITEGTMKILGLLFAREGVVAKENLVNHPRRASLTAFTLMIGLALLIALGGTFTSLSSAMVSYLDRSLGSDYILAPESLMLGGGNVGAGPELSERLKEIPGIGEVTGLRMSLSESKGTNLQMVGIDPDLYPKLSGLTFSSGNPNEAFSKLKEGRYVIINGIFASSQQVKVNDQLTLSTPEGMKSYQVAGIGMDFLNAKIATAYLSQENLERDFHERNDLLLLMNKEQGADGKAVEGAIRGVLKDYPNFAFTSTAEYKDALKVQIDQIMSFYFILLIAIAIPSLLGLINTLAIAVMERMREIGVMRAIGATRRQIRRIILAESLLLTGIGTLFSLLSGIWLGYLFVAATNVFGFKVDYAFPTFGIIVGIAAGLIFGLAGAWIPARHAAQVNLLKALKYE